MTGRCHRPLGSPASPNVFPDIGELRLIARPARTACAQPVTRHAQSFSGSKTPKKTRAENGCVTSGQKCRMKHPSKVLKLTGLQLQQ